MVNDIQSAEKKKIYGDIEQSQRKNIEYIFWTFAKNERNILYRKTLIKL